MSRVRPKILYFTLHCPGGPAYGARMRALHVGRCLQDAGDVSLVLAPLGEPTEEELARTRDMFRLAGVFPVRSRGRGGFAERLSREFDARCVNTHGERMDDENRRIVRKLVAEHDLVWFHGLRIPNFIGDWKWPGSVLDIDDIPSAFHRTAMGRAPNVMARCMEARKSLQWRRREALLSERFGAIVTCSEDDRRTLGGGDRVHVIPNGYELPGKLPARRDAGNPRIGFIGTLEYAPNRDGLEWFVREVWPAIRRERPDARLRVVGKGEPVAGLDGAAGLDALGWVDDASEEIATWSLMAVPIHIGGGTRIKIAESFARRCPVVSTTAGAFGYSVRDGGELLLADRPADFAKACLSIIGNPTLGEALADRAAARFEREWSWNAIRPWVAEVVESRLRRSATA